jgi:hypothetical protein
VRRIAASALTTQLDALERERSALQHRTGTDEHDLQRLQAAIERLAAALTGGVAEEIEP